MKVLESMAEKLVPVTIPVPKREPREMFNFFPPSFPVASDKGSSAIAKNEAEKKEVDLSKLLRHPKPQEKNINLTLSWSVLLSPHQLEQLYCSMMSLPPPPAIRLWF